LEVSSVSESSIDDWDTDGLEENEFGFFAALLIHFPEIASVRTSSDDSLLSITFLLASNPDPKLVRSFDEHFNRSLAALSRVIGDGVERIAKTSVLFFDDIASLQVVRPLHSVVAEEFPILRGMVLETFGKLVIVESEQKESAGGWELDLGENGEAYPLEHTLRRFKASGAKGHLYGFRDGERVLVYRA